jgi:hypothetical protein
MIFRAHALLAIAFLAAAGAPVSAQVMTTTIAGIVGANSTPGQDIDTLGLFGAAGADLNGLEMRITLKFDSSLMQLGGASPGYSAWSGPSGSCAAIIGGKHARPSIERETGIDSTRIYFFSDYQGTWALDQFAQSSTLPDTCSVQVLSTKHPFVPSADLVQSFSYKPPKKEAYANGDSLVLDITVGGVRETVTASVASVTYGP